MICGCRWPAIIVVLPLTGLACFRTSMDEAQRVKVNGTAQGGATGALGGTTSSPGGATISPSGVSGAMASTGGTTTAAETGPPSCVGLAATCGPSNESCCTSLPVPGGTFYRSYDGVEFTNRSYPATVNDFYFDKYDITVGRFRAFVNAGMGTQASPPAAGAGAHPLITGSGWDSTWNTNLPADTASLRTAMGCSALAFHAWTDTPGDNEDRPANCLTWYEAFAFCAWDGGRLPTEAEWNYAASGGSEQRYFPWSNPPSSTTIDDSYSVYDCASSGCIQNVGSKSPKGDGKWGQADLTGNVAEWMLDLYASPLPVPCDNCANLEVGSNRVARGGFGYSRPADRSFGVLGNYQGNIGARCARTSN